MKSILGTIERMSTPRRNRLPLLEVGPFCSELVVRIYREFAYKLGVDLKLVEQAKGARWISPNTLAQSSLLRPLSDIVLYEDPALPDESAQYVGRGLEDQREAVYCGALAKRIKESRRGVAIAKSLDRTSRKIIKRMAEAASRLQRKV